MVVVVVVVVVGKVVKVVRKVTMGRVMEVSETSWWRAASSRRYVT